MTSPSGGALTSSPLNPPSTTTNSTRERDATEAMTSTTTAAVSSSSSSALSSSGGGGGGGNINNSSSVYKKEKSIQMKNSASALYNNLSVLCVPERSLTYLAVVHRSSVCMVSASADGLNLSHRQLQAKEGGAAAQAASLVLQASWCILPSRVLLVLTSLRGIQMYESDGSIMVYWHALEIPETPTARAIFARGIAAVGGHYICVGTSSGCILVFDVPVKGTNITLSEELGQHTEAITSIAAECSMRKDCVPDLVTADDSGVLCVWKSGEEFTLLYKLPAYGCSCTSVALWDGIVAAGYGSGQIRVYDGATGALAAEANAHARWINVLDVAPESGRLLSGAEDSFVRVWKLGRAADTGLIEIEHRHSECVTDVQISGAKFCDAQGRAFAVTGYDLCEIIRYVLAA
ncbi:WD repeat-containing protein 54 isoform X2 [Lethenteron reissneri]|uniref:WD repeat-containing protein 54 isoform X2 n=1 Tax=Lethenteron reissneri TaxID=7753 RepID=UPI002AB60485|nr:WD repeat-containing protein 54 isoform X2 [Lethenteron reissneri]